MPSERVDPIVILLIATMFLVFAYLLTWFDKHPDLAIKCQFLLMLGVIGVLGRFFWAFGFQQYIRPSANISGGRAFMTAVSAALRL